MKIGIIVALDAELNCVKNLFTKIEEVEDNGTTYYVGSVGKNQIIVSKSGIGKVCSAVRAVDIINKFSPNYIINTGLAGGIDIKTKICDVVLGETITYHDVWCGDGCEKGQVMGYPKYFKSSKELIDIVLSERRDSTIHSGLICTGDQFITDGNILSGIKRNFPKGLAVDMESASIAHVCLMRNIPFLSLRIISDTPGNEDNIEQYNNFWEIAPKKSFDILKNLIDKI